MINKLRKSIYTLAESQIRKFNTFANDNGTEYFLTLGEPDFDTPESVKKAAVAAIENNETHYGPTSGLLEFREKIVEFEKKLNKVEYSVDEVIVTNGSTEALTASLLCILERGDEVIVPVPAYPQYKEIVKFAEAVYVPLDTSDNDFDITREMLEKVKTDRTKCLILTSPNNPTGHIFSDESLQEIHDFVVENNIFVICDDCYNQLVYGERRLGFSKFQDLKDNIIVCQSFSKPYSMTGWRVGYLLAERKIAEQIFKLHQYTVVAQNTFVQKGAMAALDVDVSVYVDSYKRRRDYTYRRLKEIGFEVELAEGAFYLFPSIKQYGVKSLEFCQQLVLQKKVALIPGICFESDDFVRISYCVADDVLENALDRLGEFVKENYQ